MLCSGFERAHLAKNCAAGLRKSPVHKLTNSSAFGGNPYAGPWDDLPLPEAGRTIGNTDDISLERIFAWSSRHTVQASATRSPDARGSNQVIPVC